MENILSKTVLKTDNMLVTPIVDFFKVKKDSGFTVKKSISEAPCDVGIIERVGSDLDIAWVGHIVYYQKNLVIEVEVDGVYYAVVPSSHVILVRMDINRNTYKN
jgi:hypothetical protein